MDTYVSPFSSRYGSEQMKYIFSAQYRYTSWRKLWVALAKAEKKLGLPISSTQIDELQNNINNIDYQAVTNYEHRFRHEVMAHIYAYGDVAPMARPIIHLGATSSYVIDNGDLLQMRAALSLIVQWLVSLIRELKTSASKYKDLPLLAYTHFQAAQPTTLGKRMSLWLNDLLLDLEETERMMTLLPFFGCKGTTGTQASFLELFNGDETKVLELERLLAADLKFKTVVPVSGQTYTRKYDSLVINVLSGIAQSATKFANDIRLMAHMKEVDEPFEDEQIGSSAMPYKKNPMRSERLTSLARYVMSDALNPAWTASAQWLERTLDDSAIKRLSLPEAFLATDEILNLYLNIISGLRVYPKVMKKHLDEELPFMASEAILMYLVKEKGFDRQEMHEIIREHALAAGKETKIEGKPNDLLVRLLNDNRLGLSRDTLNKLADPQAFIGRAPQQTVDFINQVVDPLLDGYQNISSNKSRVDL